MPAAQRQTGNTLLGIFIGLLLGLAIASVIAIYMMKSPFPFTQKERERTQRADRAGPAAKIEPPRREEKSADASKQAERPATEPATIVKEAGKTPERPIAAERRDPPAETVKSDTPAAPANETFMLQAGSFPNPVDADNQKARLALIGLEASIEPVDLPDRGTWYRVRLGPYRTLGEVNQIRSQLAANGVEVQLIRSRPAN